MNAYSPSGPTKATTSSEEEELTSDNILPPMSVQDDDFHHNHLLSRNLSHTQLTSSDSASSLSMSSSYERRVMSSAFLGKDHFDIMPPKGGSDCLMSPNGSSGGSSGCGGDAVFLNERVRNLESEKLSLMVDHNTLIKDFNKRMQSYLDEIRTLKEVNQGAEQEIAEMRDLCCFLDDDRRKCRKLAKEWQKFGRNTVTTLKTEVATYQQQVAALDHKNTQLMQENFELRELCLHLDQQSGNGQANADSDFKFTCQQCANRSSGSSQSLQMSENIALLENKVEQLEKERDMMHRLLTYGKSPYDRKRVSFTFPNDDGCDSSSTASELDFPPTALSMELLSKPSTLQENAEISNGLASLEINTGRDDHTGVTNGGSPFDQCEPLYTSTTRNSKLNMLLKSKTAAEEGASVTPIVPSSQKLPGYEDSVRFLETSRLNNNNNNVKVNGFSVRPVPSESDVL